MRKGRETDLKCDVMFSTLGTLLDCTASIQSNREHHRAVAEYDQLYNPPQLTTVYAHERKLLESILHEMEVLIPSVKQRILYLGSVSGTGRNGADPATIAAADA